jgi:hypothetical protein
VETKDAGSGQGIERRRFLQHTATVAFAAPVIVSMMSGAARAAGIGDQCGTKTGGVGDTTCNVTEQCSTGLECHGLPAGPAGTPCTCVPVP